MAEYKLNFRYFSSFDANVDVACEVTRLELPASTHIEGKSADEGITHIGNLRVLAFHAVSACAIEYVETYMNWHITSWAPKKQVNALHTTTGC